MTDSDAMEPKITNPSNPNIKRICLASLVKAVYEIERNREKDSKAASKWHKKFNYKCKQILRTPSDGSIFGAVFVLCGTNTVVIAFRGTILSRANMRTDVHDNLKLIVQQLHKDPRVDEALRVTRKMTIEYGPQNISLAGHSLGAAIATLVGQEMAMQGFILDTHLFNPPFFSLFPVRNEIIGFCIEKLRQSVAQHLSGSKDNDARAQAQATFTALQKWNPNLYINVSDPVCCNYVHYFRARDSSTAQNSIINSLLDLMGQNPRPHHLMPSANLFINSTLPLKVNRFRKIKEAHALDQWWSEDTPPLQDEQYRLDVQL